MKKDFTIPALLITAAFCAAAASTAVGGVIAGNLGAQPALENLGYTNVVVQKGSPASHCDKLDAWAGNFQATKDGKPAKGSICLGYSTKFRVIGG